MSNVKHIAGVRQAEPLFRRPRISLGQWPTPVVRLARFGASVGFENLWMKREDVCRPDCGGNKVRGLEFVLADALARGATSLLTIGAAGSFHVRATAICGREVGLGTTAVLMHQPNGTYVRRNLVAALAAGARLIAPPMPLLPLAMVREWLRRDEKANRSYFIPPGGTSPLAALGHVNATFELREQIRAGQLPEPDYIVVPLGSLGTAAGLAAGCVLAGLKSRVIGVVVFAKWFCTASRWARLANGTLAHGVGAVPRVEGRDLIVVRDALGRGYAHFTQEAADLAKGLFELEGVGLDGAYSAKAVAGAIGELRRRQAERANVLLWHTYCNGVDGARTVELPRGLRRYDGGPVQELDGAFVR